MLRITHVEEIERILLLLPALVREQEARSPFFPDNVAGWLAQAEKMLAAKNLYQAATIAVLRSDLALARQGHLRPGVALRGVPSRSRIRSVAAAQAISRAAEVLSAIVQENRPRFAEAEAIAQQLVAVALAQSLVVPPHPAMSRTDYLLDLRGRVLSSELATALLRLEGLVGPNDVLVLLDRALELRNVVPTDLPAGGEGAESAAGPGAAAAAPTGPAGLLTSRE